MDQETTTIIQSPPDLSQTESVFVQLRKKFETEFPELCGPSGCNDSMDCKTRKCIISPQLFVDRYLKTCQRNKHLLNQLKMCNQNNSDDLQKLMIAFIDEAHQHETLKLRHKRLIKDLKTMYTLLTNVLSAIESTSSPSPTN